MATRCASVEWENGGDDARAGPYDIDLSTATLQLYDRSNSRVDILIDLETGVHVLGYYPGDNEDADLIIEDDWRMLWGVSAGPGTMTDIGRQLFVNMAHRYVALARLKRQSSPWATMRQSLTECPVLRSRSDCDCTLRESWVGPGVA